MDYYNKDFSLQPSKVFKQRHIKTLHCKEQSVNRHVSDGDLQNCIKFGVVINKDMKKRIICKIFNNIKIVFSIKNNAVITVIKDDKFIAVYRAIKGKNNYKNKKYEKKKKDKKQNKTEKI